MKALLTLMLVCLTYVFTPLFSQQQQNPNFLTRHHIEEYCGHDKLSASDLRPPNDSGDNRDFNQCGATLSTCYSSCTVAIPTCFYRVPIVFTVITDGSGNTELGATEAEVLANIDAALARCNSYYAGAGIEFIQCQLPRNADGTDPIFDSADFYDFDSQTSGDNDDNEIEVYDITNVINVYLAPDVASSGTAVCGYAKFPGLFTNGRTYDQDLHSVISTDCFTGDETTLEHELGHFFGLEHTHNGASSSTPNEAADGSEACNYSIFNGATYSMGFTTANIGDGIEDTSPDPNLSGDVGTSCNYIGTYVPDGGQPLPLNNIMSYSTDFYCAKMVFTSCQLEKIQQTLLNCRDYLICTDATTEVLESDIEICQGASAPTFFAVTDCYSWYSAASGGSALTSSSQTFTPPMSSSDLNTVGTYTYYVEFDNDYYSTSFSGSAYDTYSSHPASPTSKRKAITVTVKSGACNSTPGDGTDNCAIIICDESCTFTTSGANFSAPFSAADYRTGWALTSGASTSVGSQEDIDALPASQVFGPYLTTNSDHTFTVGCTAGVPDLGVGVYNVTPFVSKVAAAATTETFSSGAISKAISNTDRASSGIEVSGLPDNATVSQICVTFSHNYAGIVSVNVGAPEGMGYVELVNRIGFPASRPYGYSSQYNGTYCFEAGAGSFPEPSSGFVAAGTYAPADSDFGNFIPRSPNGNWGLTIASPVGGVSGALTNWTITFDVPAVSFPEIDRTVEANFGEPIEFEIAISLPVDLLSFDAKLQGSQVALDWITESEENNSHFQLQRSVDGIFFKNIASIEGAGTSYNVHTYQYLDREPEAGFNYYRLLTVDFDGSLTASEVIAVEVNSFNNLMVMPNPLSGQQMTLAFTSVAEEAVDMEIQNISGQIIWREKNLAQRGNNEWSISIPELDQGMYLLKFRQGHAERTERFVKL